MVPQTLYQSIRCLQRRRFFGRFALVCILAGGPSVSYESSARHEEARQDACRPMGAVKTGLTELYWCHREEIEIVARLCGETDVKLEVGGRWTLESAVWGCSIRRQNRPYADQMALGKKLNINQVPAHALRNLPGIGPTMARRIDAARPFHTMDGLRRIKGIGPKRLEMLAPLIRIQPATSAAER